MRVVTNFAKGAIERQLNCLFCKISYYPLMLVRRYMYISIFDITRFSKKKRKRSRLTSMRAVGESSYSGSWLWQTLRH